MTNASLAPQDLSLTGATTRGTAWMIAQSLAGKAVNTGGQIVLTWLLAPEYWGLIALTNILVMFGEELRAMGVLQVLVHRQKRYRRWANVAFWMSTAVGLAAGLLMIAAAKPMAVICHAPWELISAGLARGRTMTSWPTIQDDVRNAGANWVDREVVVDGNLVTSRGPQDLPAFNREMTNLFASHRPQPAVR